MRRRALLVGAVLLVATNGVAAQAAVKIYAELGGNTRQGTGFFVDDGGQIITAYHVVQGARGIEVTHAQLGNFPNVVVEFIAPQFDLAILRLSGTVPATPYILLSEMVPSAGEELTVIGYPQQMGPSQEVLARATRSDLVDSRTIRTPSGARLFLEGIEVIPIDVTIYGGMSGAPLVRAGRAIGVVSASFNEGGGIGWAIPMKYVGQSTDVGGRPPNQVDWPELTLMSSAFRSAQRTIQVDEIGERLLADYFGEVGKLGAVYDELRLVATQIQASAVVNRMVLRRVQSNLQQYDRETIGEILEGSVQTLIALAERFGELNSEHSEAMGNIASRLSQLSAWAQGSAGVSAALLDAIDVRVDAVNTRYAGLKGGYFTAIGAEESALESWMGQATDFFTLAGQGDMAPALTALGKFIDGADAVAAPHASVQAVEFASRDVERWRSIGTSFEPTVYREVGAN